ncbi:MAG: DUF4926 domain-containing protein [Acidobacteria bacterium]|nr:DUF4926 domain-containing protein [Acidobacteriota bacterium]
MLSALKDSRDIRVLDPVALIEDLKEFNLRRGELGTVVEELDGAFLVEFSDNNGEAYAIVPVSADQLLPLHRGGATAA